MYSAEQPRRSPSDHISAQTHTSPPSAASAQGLFDLPREASDLSASGALGSLLLIALHAPLALAMQNSEALATVHALGAFVVCLWLVLRNPPAWIVYVGCYLAGSEVLWRMTHAHVVWEFGKYTLIAVFLLGAVRHRALLKIDGVAVTYFLGLVPSALLLIADRTITGRELVGKLSFNMAGPLVLALGAIVLSNVVLEARDVRRAAVGLACPIAAIAVLAITGTIENPDVEFTLNSSFGTSGGYGPNQVSVALALGATLALFTLAFERLNVGYRFLLSVCFVVFAGQSAMTFSRGGLYSAGAGVVVALLLSAADVKLRKRAFWSLVAIGSVAVLLGPRLNHFTDGMLSERFESTSTTGRTELMREDLATWWAHPGLGVGPGMSLRYRDTIQSIAHTELTRMLAEHGIPGLVSLAAMFLMFFSRLRTANSARDRAWAGGLMAWSIVTMVHAAMRTATPSFVFALAMAMLAREEESPAIGATLRVQDAVPTRA